MKTLLLIHHSHTDIGYTGPQSRIERLHVDFVRQALAAIRNTGPAIGPHFTGFRWTCETFWAVERFLDRAAPHEVEEFEVAVRTGDVGLSASYLNMNELADYELLSGLVGRASRYGRSLGVHVDTAMTADINGYSWGFARALAENGVENLFTCIHTHHGMYPLGRQQVAFWWEAPGGGSVLVWSGEHYHFGNELGVAPGAVSSYLTKDECDAEMIFHDHWGVAERRIPRYLEALECSGYVFDFVPVMVSGLRTDNAPPSPLIADFVARWNRERGDVCRIEMTTPTAFFARLRETAPDLPTYSGDWPDWWSDGLAGNPVSTSLFREAQRELRRYRSLRGTAPAPPGDTRPLEDLLALYSEHTFSHCDSVRSPWDSAVHEIADRKKAYAAQALDTARGLVADALSSAGEAGLVPGAPLVYKAINELDREVRGMAALAVGHHEFNELGLDRGAEVIDVGTGETVPSQMRQAPLGAEFCVHVELGPGEETLLRLEGRSDGPDPAAAEQPAATAAAGAEDRSGSIETPFVSIEWARGDGIVSWYDRALGRELLRRDRHHAAFTPVYERTPVHGRDDVCAARGRMGLNRKGEDVARTAGCLIGSLRSETGDVFATAELDYGLPGAALFVVRLCAYMDEPRVDVTVRLHKDSAWEPENLYLSLPFDTGSSTSALWLDKAGAAVRPRVDQLPGTLTDFYCVQEGLALISDDMGVAVATRDAPLVQVGPLEHGERLLMGDPRLASDPALPYSWVMTNYWETNFAAELGGFHQFRYSVMWGDELADADAALAACAAANSGITCFRLADGV